MFVANNWDSSRRLARTDVAFKMPRLLDTYAYDINIMNRNEIIGMF